jgi:hypothetical protein
MSMNAIEHAMSSKVVPNRMVLPRRYQSASLADLDDTYRNIVTSYMDGFFGEYAETGRGPVLLGRHQARKSIAACVMAKEANAKVDAAYLNVLSVMGSWSDRKFHASTWEKIDLAKTVPFLVVDEFLEVGTNKYAKDVLTSILTGRHAELLPTVWVGTTIFPGSRHVRKVQEVFSVVFAEMLADTSRGLIYPGI